MEEETDLTPEQQYQITKERLTTVAILQLSTGIVQLMTLVHGLEYMQTEEGCNQSFLLTYALMQTLGVSQEQVESAFMDYAMDPLGVWGPYKGVVLPKPLGEEDE